MDDTTQNAEHEPHAPLTRRQVLKTAAGAGLILLAPMLADHAEAATTPDQWTAAGKGEDFVVSMPKRVALANGDILYITRQDAQTLMAVSAKCTHQGCEVGWKTADSQFHCPCHGAVFAVSGKNVSGPSRRPTQTLSALPTMPVRQNGAQVEVNLAGVTAADFHPRAGG